MLAMSMSRSNARNFFSIFQITADFMVLTFPSMTSKIRLLWPVSWYVGPNASQIQHVNFMPIQKSQVNVG